ncbi:L-proline glycine betaine ABC transport system permease protein ProV [Weissella jogaejeotgali]|uniref:ABC-type quaternary amine transporter n=2 Tax=Weissella TaxID=46255 RepID=A0A1L6RAB6_9LACO|nr:ABC transporter ATP-binding protein [Weissella jogaejeotgali]APS41438.1 L-proline glycine betaine ABC transport system permease protein ProV [Weissella jogaejeotgali]
MIKFSDVVKTYQEKQVVNKLNLTVASGEFFVLVGPSGSGKTTILKMINRLIEQSAGEILIDDINVNQVDTAKLRKNIGYVLQNIALFPNLTITQNAGILLEAQGVKRDKRETLVNQLLDRVGLPHEQYGSRMPSELSGGEQQRVGIVRALITKPDIILMDEPFSALDPLSRKQLQDLILDLYEELKPTILFVTHDMHEALRLGTRIGVLVNGHLEQVGSPNKIISEPANKTVSSLFDNQRVTLISDMQSAGLLHPLHSEYPVQTTQLSATQTIQELAMALRGVDQVIIDQQYVVTADDVLQYIGQQ